MKVDKWGLWSLGLSVGGLVLSPAGRRFFHDEWNVFLAVHTLMQVSAVYCGIVAALRGSKLWLLISLCAAGLAIQAFVALVVE